MKLIIAIIRDVDNDAISRALTQESYRVTRIASTGGFLRSGRNTLLIGVDDEKVNAAIDILRANCTQPPDAHQKSVTLFVVDVEEFAQL